MAIDLDLQLGAVMQRQIADNPGKQQYWIVTGLNSDSTPVLDPVTSKKVPIVPTDVEFIPQGATLHEGMQLFLTDLVLKPDEMAVGMEYGLRHMESAPMPEDMIQKLVGEARKRWASLQEAQ